MLDPRRHEDDWYLLMKSANSAGDTGLSTNNAARESRPLVRRMNVNRLSSVGSSSIRRLASNTTVSFIPRSLVDFLRSAIERASSVSCLRSSFSLSSRSLTTSGPSGSRGERGPDGGEGFSKSRRKRTKTEGTREVCFLIQIGAMRPSG